MSKEKLLKWLTISLREAQGREGQLAVRTLINEIKRKIRKGDFD